MVVSGLLENGTSQGSSHAIQDRGSRQKKYIYIYTTYKKDEQAENSDILRRPKPEVYTLLIG